MPKIIGITTATPYAGMPNNIWSSIYSDNSPNWVQHDSIIYDPPLFGKDIYFNSNIKTGEKYFVRVNMEHQEGYNEVEIVVTTKNSSDAEDHISTFEAAHYKEDTGCYEFEFTAMRDTLKGEELMLFVSYPKDAQGGRDYSATHGKAEILYKGTLQNVIDKQNDKIASINTDIESALDEIIAIQNNLIGGGSV